MSSNNTSLPNWFWQVFLHSSRELTRTEVDSKDLGYCCDEAESGDLGRTGKRTLKLWVRKGLHVFRVYGVGTGRLKDRNVEREKDGGLACEASGRRGFLTGNKISSIK